MEFQYFFENIFFSSHASSTHTTICTNATEVFVSLVFSCRASNFDEIEPKKSKIDEKMRILELIDVATLTKKYPVFHLLNEWRMCLLYTLYIKKTLLILRQQLVISFY